ncbi:hypothetical protein BGZ61DRAFT_454378 [Ilyonectria robusta]|uniref:uncharacterized protein n=1 Tax=Ilyonectria robusta TaxID=1079257 RepID=UPI001E8EC6A2|nr:uncharacterized protein BGZ61DRAFT_454378 [Ilyonectria robusta]KAH8686365.1 hypothetical protein BGZ61DRAFT_454378 [Ilyonectria robusta]
MSIVTPGLLRMHYDEAHREMIEGPNNQDNKSWEFWQQLVISAFHEVNRSSIIAGSSSRTSIRQTEIVVRRYDEESDGLFSAMCVRCRRPDISLGKIEQMALDAARSHIDKEKLEWIWAMTTFGVSFRVWFVDKDAVRLIPMHGTATDGDEGQYIDVASPEASVISNVAQLIREGLPLDAASIPTPGTD